MSDYGVFEASSTDGHEEEQRQRQATRDLGTAIESAREGFGDFLGAATDKQDYQDRLALVMNDLMQKVADSGVMPVPGVMRKVKAALRPEFKQAAGWSKGTSPDISDLSKEQLQGFIDNIQESIDAGVNVGQINENKRDRFQEELRSRSASRKEANDIPWFSNRDGSDEVRFSNGSYMLINPDGSWQVGDGTFMTTGQESSVERAKEVAIEQLFFFGSKTAYDSSSVPGMYAQWASDAGLDPHSNETLAEFGKQFSGLSYDMQQEISQEFLSSRKQADAASDTHRFVLYLQGVGFRQPKDAGRPGGGGEMDDELYDYFRGDQSTISEVSQYLNDNWDYYAYGIGASRKQASDVNTEDQGVLQFFYQFEDEGLDVSASGDEQWEWLKSNIDYDTLQDAIDQADEYGEVSRSNIDSMAYDLQQNFFGSRKQASAYLPVVSVEQDLSDSYLAELKGGFAFEAYDEGGTWVWSIFDNSGMEVAGDETFSLDAAKDDAAYALERVASRKRAFSEQLGVHLTEVFESGEAGGGWRQITGERLDWEKGDLEFYGGSGFFRDWSLEDDGGEEVFAFSTNDDSVIIVPPAPSRYAFEKVGSTKEALGLSGLSVGDEVYWYSGGDDVDTSSSGVIVELPAVDPDGRVHSDMAAVEWADDGYDIVEINNLLNAEHYNIGQGYSQALGSRKQANAFDELMDFLGDDHSGAATVEDVKEYLNFEKDFPGDRYTVTELAEELEDYFGYDLSEFRTASRTAGSADTEAAQDLYARFIKYMNDRGMHHQTGNTEFYAEDFLSEENVDPYFHDLFWSEFDRRQASRTAGRTAFLDTVQFAEPKHRVAGWDWDDHLNGFIAAQEAREFTCACGDSVPAPGYTDCRCGKRWNCYQVKANGTAKFIAREVPVRDGVVMARRTAAGNGWETPPIDLGTLSDEELRKFVFDVQHAIDGGANIGTIMENKKSHFRDELIRRGWRVDGMGYPYQE